MGGFSNFAVSFSIISILTGAITLYGYGYSMGGALEMSLGWPVASLFSLLLAASMAELCSAYPSSAAMYHWTAALGSSGLAWLVCWLNIIGLVSMLAAINYSCAQFLAPLLRWPEGGLFVLFALITASQYLFNLLRVKWVALLNDCSVPVHIGGVLIILGALFFFAPLQPLPSLSGRSANHPYWWSFALGLLQAHWTFTGFDASAHMAEETQDPRRKAPWGIVLSVAVAGVFGYALLVMLTLAIPQAGLGNFGDTPMAIAIFQAALGQRAATLLSAGVGLAMWFCGLSTLMSASRTVYAFARDGGLAGAAIWRKVDSQGIPRAALGLVAAASIIAMAWSSAIPVITSLSTVSLYWAYMIPVFLGWRKRQVWIGEAVWNLGAAGWWVNLIALIYCAGICVVLVMPPNELAGKTLAGIVLFLGLLWFGGVRKTFEGPVWTR
jgi:amino acid transporter